MQPSTNVDQNFETALADWMHVGSQKFGIPISSVQLELVDDTSFWVSLTHDADFTLLQVSKGVKLQIDRLTAAKNILSPIECILRYAAGFLVFHELGHIALGHFKMAECFGIAQRSSTIRTPLNVVPSEVNSLFSLCLEMQADHQATDLLLGPYSTDGQLDVRSKVLAISGMMMLIELQDNKNGAEGRTHPKAATRVFQLFGHLAEMPLVQAHLQQDPSQIPSEDELQAFARDVTIPCFFDAIQLAQAAGAASTASDLGSPEDFFKDLEIAKLGDPTRYTEFKTQGAQEWAKLWPCNEALKPILGSHFTT